MNFRGTQVESKSHGIYENLATMSEVDNFIDCQEQSLSTYIHTARERMEIPEDRPPISILKPSQKGPRMLKSPRVLNYISDKVGLPYPMQNLGPSPLHAGTHIFSATGA